MWTSSLSERLARRANRVAEARGARTETGFADLMAFAEFTDGELGLLLPAANEFEPALLLASIGT